MGVTHVWNVIRGVLIGTVETVPGVSGGTVALVVGVYETAITSAGHLLSGVRWTIADGVRGRGLSRAKEEYARVNWRVIVPLLVGMFAALVVMARVVEGWVEDSPIESRALFFGLVLASLWVPFSLAARAKPATRSRLPRAGEEDAATGRSSRRREAESAGSFRWMWGDAAVAIVAAALAFVIVSIPPSQVESSRPVIVIAAAVAVSALVLPGLSGSFILLTFGLYEPTLEAVNERDLGYLAVFALGAALGLASFVKLLQWLLEHRRRITLVILTGVMAGCLRALWPWQEEDRTLLAPGDDIGTAVGLATLGFVVVLMFVLFERRWAARSSVQAA